MTFHNFCLETYNFLIQLVRFNRIAINVTKISNSVEIKDSWDLLLHIFKLQYNFSESSYLKKSLKYRLLYIPTNWRSQKLPMISNHLSSLQLF